MGIVFALGLLFAAGTSSEVAARGGMGGAVHGPGIGHGPGFGRPGFPGFFRHHVRRGSRYYGYPYYGYGYYGYYGPQATAGYYPLIDDNLITGSVAPLTPPPPTCQHSQEVVNVPAAGGGTKAVTISRC
jgi:hypothetical protein